MAKKEPQVRKLAAIMFTDMVGYSALTQKNESLALELLEEHRRLLRPLFPRHNGTEIETAGDAFFVEFVSALDAMRCAIEIQTKMFQRNSTVEPERHIRLRIGLHLGDVVHQGKHVHGDGVNIAARVEPCAAPGSICVSEDIARQVENKINLRLIRLAKRELKNIQLPVAIYRVEMPWEKQHPPESHRFASVLKSNRKVLYGMLAVTIVALIAFSLFRFFTTLPANSNSIAVLPFRNFSEDKEDWFSDGMTEDVVAALSKIAALTVISPTPPLQYKNRERSPREIGKELNVASVLDGNVRRDGSQVRIVAKLVSTSDDRNLWTGTYDQEFSNIFSIQSEVAQKIAEKLEATISPAEKERIEKKSTVNLEAYDLYLKGRYYWNRRLPDSLKKGIECFKQAIAKDPNYALAYAGLADSYTILGNYNLLPPRETYPKAKEAASKALSIDPNLAEAHASLGFAIMNYDWDWVAAEKELKRAIEINPNYAIARSWHAFLLTVTGRFEEATRVRKKALELDPRSPVINADVGLTLYYSGKYDEAIRQFEKTLQIDPNFLIVNIAMAGAYEQKKVYDTAMAKLTNLTAGLTLASIRHPIPIAALGHVYALSGKKYDAQNMLDLLKEMSDNQYVAPYWMAVLYVGLGEKEQALDWLEKAFEGRDGSMVFLKVDPVFNGIRSDPRFVRLIKKMGLGGTGDPQEAVSHQNNQRKI